jgi:hypothetical protein
MDLRLDFRGGRITGSGIDDVGRFAIGGTYEEETLRCRWRKTYVGRHTVLYDGAWDLGSIWGLWTIPPSARGGFRIWPGARGEGIARYEETEADVTDEEPVEAMAPRLPGTL